MGGRRFGLPGSALASEVKDRPDAKSNILLRLVGSELSDVQSWRKAHRYAPAHPDIEVAADKSRELRLIGDAIGRIGNVAVSRAKDRPYAGREAPFVKQPYLWPAHEAVLSNVGFIA